MYFLLYTLEVVGHGIETQLQLEENSNCIN